MNEASSAFSRSVSSLGGQVPLGEGTGARVCARGWGWRHAGRKNAALSGVDFDIAPGERVLVLGPSGSGKSTLMGGLAGLLGGWALLLVGLWCFIRCPKEAPHVPEGNL